MPIYGFVWGGGSRFIRYMILHLRTGWAKKTAYSDPPTNKRLSGPTTPTAPCAKKSVAKKAARALLNPTFR